MMYVKMGLRNIWRNRRRSLLTISAIGVGFAGINLFSGYVADIYADLQDQAIVGERLGHLTLAKRGFYKQGKLEPEKYLLNREELDRLTRVVSAFPETRLVSPRLEIRGLISTGRTSTIFMGEGVRASDMRVIRGERYGHLPGMLDPAKPEGAGVATDLAALLDLKQGEGAVLLTSTPEGLTNALEAEVAEIFDTGNASTNDKLMLFPFEFAQRLYNFEGAERVVLLLDDVAHVPQVRRRLAEHAGELGFALEVKEWTELSSFFQQVRSMFGMIFLFLFAIVLVIVVMSVANTMGMVVLERTREIGTLRSLGMKRRSVLALFSVEGALLALTGCLAGLTACVLLAAAVNVANVTYVPPNSSSPIQLQVALSAVDLLRSFAFLALLATATALWPARRAARLEIVDAFGHV